MVLHCKGHRVLPWPDLSSPNALVTGCFIRMLKISMAARFSHNFKPFKTELLSLIWMYHVLWCRLLGPTNWKPQFVGRRKARLGTQHKRCLRHWSPFEMERLCMKKRTVMPLPRQFQRGAHLQCSAQRRWQNCNFPLFWNYFFFFYFWNSHLSDGFLYYSDSCWER